MLFKNLAFVVVACLFAVAFCDRVAFGQPGGGPGSGEIPVNENPLNPWNPYQPNVPPAINCYITKNMQCSEVMPGNFVQTLCVARICRKHTEVQGGGIVEVYRCSDYPQGEDSYEKRVRTDIEVPYVDDNVLQGGWTGPLESVVHCVVGYDCICEFEVDGSACKAADEAFIHESPVTGWVIDLENPCED